MTDEPIYQALEVLRKGGIILYPTDTVWGIGCDATNDEAVERIYRLKRSGEKKSMLVLLDNPDKVSLYIRKVPDIAWQLYEVAADADPAGSLRRRREPDPRGGYARHPDSRARVLQEADPQAEPAAGIHLGQHLGPARSAHVQ